MSWPGVVVLLAILQQRKIYHGIDLGDEYSETKRAEGESRRNGLKSAY